MQVGGFGAHGSQECQPQLPEEDELELTVVDEVVAEEPELELRSPPAPLSVSVSVSMMTFPPQVTWSRRQNNSVSQTISLRRLFIPARISRVLALSCTQL